MDFEARFRNKITFIQFLLSIGIVYQHTVWNYSGSMVLNTLQSFLFYLLETCVPFFHDFWLPFLSYLQSIKGKDENCIQNENFVNSLSYLEHVVCVIYNRIN